MHSPPISLIPVIHQRRHPNIIPLHLGPSLPLCGKDYNYNPKNPDSACNEAICDYCTRALPSQGETEKTVNDSNGDNHAPEPDVYVGVERSALVAFVLKVMDVAEDGLRDEKHDYDNAENRMERGELNYRVSGVSNSRFFSQAYISRTLFRNVDTESESKDRTQVREQLHGGMNPNQAPE